jgi:CRISPR-associated protein Cas2
MQRKMRTNPIRRKMECNDQSFAIVRRVARNMIDCDLQSATSGLAIVAPPYEKTLIEKTVELPWNGAQRSWNATRLIAVTTVSVCIGFFMRRTTIVTYDIRDSRRLRQVFRILKNWGDHLQLSVFECQLTASEYVSLRTELGAVIHHELDQVLFIDLGPTAKRGDRVIEALGQPYSLIDASCIVV